MLDQGGNDFAGVFWDRVAGFEDDCPVMKEVFIQSEENQLRFWGIVKRCGFKWLEDMLV